MYTYRLYGLAICSNKPLALVAADGARRPTVTVAFACSGRQLPSGGALLRHASPYCNAQGESLLQVWQLPAGAGYWVRSSIGDTWADYQLTEDGSRVEVMQRADTPLPDLVVPLFGVVLPLVLRLRGVTCLHASAVLVNDHVIALTGPAETGKSTTLTALLQHDCSFFSDELAPIHICDGRVVTYGGFPRVGLWPDAMTALFGPQADLPYLWQESPTRPDKRIYTPHTLLDSAAPTAYPLGALYLLDQRQASAHAGVHIAGLNARDAVAQLVPHTTGRAVASAADRAADLTRLVHLARTVPVRRVKRPDDLAQLDAVAEAILADMARLLAAGRQPADPLRSP